MVELELVIENGELVAVVAKQAGDKIPTLVTCRNLDSDNEDRFTINNVIH